MNRLLVLSVILASISSVTFAEEQTTAQTPEEQAQYAEELVVESANMVKAMPILMEQMKSRVADGMHPENALKAMEANLVAIQKEEQRPEVLSMIQSSLEIVRYKATRDILIQRSTDGSPPRLARMPQWALDHQSLSVGPDGHGSVTGLAQSYDNYKAEAAAAVLAPGGTDAFSGSPVQAVIRAERRLDRLSLPPAAGSVLSSDPRSIAAEMTQTRNKIETLEVEVSRSATEINNTRAEIRRIDNQIAELERSVQVKTRERDQLATERANLVRELDQHRRSFQTNLDRYNVLASKINNWEAEIASDPLGFYYRHTSDCRKTGQTWMQGNVEIFGYNYLPHDAAVAEAREYSRKAGEDSRSIVRIEAKINALQPRLNALNAELSAPEARLRELRSNKTALQRRIASLESENAQRSRTMDNLRAVYQSLAAKLRSIVDSLKAKVGEFNEWMTNASNWIDRFRP